MDLRHYIYSVCLNMLWGFILIQIKHMLFYLQPMMDRNKADDLPKLQCGFIDFVCAFVYKVRSSILISKQNDIWEFIDLHFEMFTGSRRESIRKQIHNHQHKCTAMVLIRCLYT